MEEYWDSCSDELHALIEEDPWEFVPAMVSTRWCCCF